MMRYRLTKWAGWVSDIDILHVDDCGVYFHLFELVHIYDFLKKKINLNDMIF